MFSFSRFKPGNKQADGVLSLLGSASQLAQQLAALRFDPTYIAGFVSPHVDIDAVARQLTQRFFSGGDQPVHHLGGAVQR